MPALALIAATACSPVYENHGYAPPPDVLAQVEVGRDTRDDIVQDVGQPTAEGVLGEDAWYYVQSRFREYGWRAPEEIDRQVVAISFAPSGTVSNVERFGLEQGRVVPISREVTETTVQDTGFLRQLFGNIGNFNPAGLLDE